MTAAAHPSEASDLRGIRTRADIGRDLEHIAQLCKAASWVSSLDLPVRLVAVPEGGLQAFDDEVLDLDHATFARVCAIDIPGPETQFLGDLAGEFREQVIDKQIQLMVGARGVGPRPEGLRDPSTSPTLRRCGPSVLAWQGGAAPTLGRECSFRSW